MDRGPTNGAVLGLESAKELQGLRSARTPRTSKHTPLYLLTTTLPATACRSASADSGPPGHGVRSASTARSGASPAYALRTLVTLAQSTVSAGLLLTTAAASSSGAMMYQRPLAERDHASSVIGFPAASPLWLAGPCTEETVRTFFRLTMRRCEPRSWLVTEELAAMSWSVPPPCSQSSSPSSRSNTFWWNACSSASWVGLKSSVPR
mmetsp:Transcript_1422/g.3337  ORF Transcript_1422/g.3337 Transcript_1422/m.3337 type:complete len:207 (-) Transcript_1422:588-1208(-)